MIQLDLIKCQIEAKKIVGVKFLDHTHPLDTSGQFGLFLGLPRLGQVTGKKHGSSPHNALVGSGGP
jgi:hypothetical protein